LRNDEEIRQNYKINLDEGEGPKQKKKKTAEGGGDFFKCSEIWEARVRGKGEKEKSCKKAIALKEERHERWKERKGLEEGGSLPMARAHDSCELPS